MLSASVNKTCPYSLFLIPFRLLILVELPSDAELGDLSQVEIYFGSMNALSKIIHLCVNLKWAQSMAAGKGLFHIILVEVMVGEG